MQFVEIEWNGPLYEREIELRDQLLRAPLGLVFTDEEIQEESGQLHFGMLDQSSLVACAVIVPLSRTKAKLRQMAVAPYQQRNGVGSILVQHIESTLRDRQFQHVELHARQTAVGFYERLGYHTVGSTFIEVKIPHRKMIKSIAG